MRHGGRDPNTTSCVDASTTASVFASSDAEMAIINRIATSLAEPARMVSPTDFHNSVHNTAAGYWGIAAKCSRATTTLAAYDGTCVAGLHEALGVLADGEAAVLLVLYDVPAPAPLHEKRPIAFPFGTALLLTAQSTATSIATVRRAEVAQETPMGDAALETLRIGNPSARILPLLTAIASRSHALIGIKDIGGTSVGVEVDARPR